jgi:hypothetical protein
MKTNSALVLTVLFLPMPLGFAADDLPKTPSFARYEGMMNKSPFAVATAVVPPPQAPNFAKDLYIANAAKLEDEGVVTLSSSTDKNLKEYLSTKGPNKSGYSISNIEWSDRVGATKVTISKDGQFATLTFNQALISQPMTNTPMVQPIQPQPVVQQPVQAYPQQPPPQQQQAGVPPTNPYGNTNTIKPAPIPTLPTPPPRVRGVIQRNPTAVPPPQQQPNSGVVPDEQ